MRLFIAIEIPDNLKKMIGRLNVDIPGARWEFNLWLNVII